MTEAAAETATLVQTETADARLAPRLASRCPGYVLITSGATAIALRGTAIITPQSRPLIHFAVSDTSTNGSRRR